MSRKNLWKLIPLFIFTAGCSSNERIADLENDGREWPSIRKELSEWRASDGLVIPIDLGSFGEDDSKFNLGILPRSYTCFIERISDVSEITIFPFDLYEISIKKRGGAKVTVKDLNDILNLTKKKDITEDSVRELIVLTGSYALAPYFDFPWIINEGSNEIAVYGDDNGFVVERNVYKINNFYGRGELIKQIGHVSFEGAFSVKSEKLIKDVFLVPQNGFWPMALSTAKENQP